MTLTKRNGLLSFIIAKPVEMLIGAMATTILFMVTLIYSENHAVIERVATRLDAIEKRQTAMEATSATQGNDIKWITQYGLIPKPISPEDYKK